MLTLVSEAVGGATLDPAALVKVVGAYYKADSTGIVDVALAMIDDVAIVDCADTRAAA